MQMRLWKQWAASFTLVGVAASALAPRAAATELTSQLGAPVYVEDFDLETAFPLSPETDPFEFGGMAGYQRGDPLAPLPTLTGTELAIAVVEADPSSASLQASGAFLAFTPPAGEGVGLRGHFDGFAAVRDATRGQFQTATVTLGDTTIANGAAGYLLDFQSGALRLAVSNLGPLFLGGYDDVFLTQTAEDAIRAGDPFEIELLFDRVARTAQASLTVGEESFQTAATTSSTFDTMEIDSALIANTTANNDAPLASIASNAQRFEIYVPEPSATALNLASFLALMLGAILGRLRG